MAPNPDPDPEKETDASEEPEETEEKSESKRAKKDKEKVFTENTLALVGLFEGATGVRIKDCIEFESRVVFIIPHGTLKEALGRNAANVKRLRDIIRKRVHVVEGF